MSYSDKFRVRGINPRTRPFFRRIFLDFSERVNEDATLTKREREFLVQTSARSCRYVEAPDAVGCDLMLDLDAFVVESPEYRVPEGKTLWYDVCCGITGDPIRSGPTVAIAVSNANAALRQYGDEHIKEEIARIIAEWGVSPRYDESRENVVCERRVLRAERASLGADNSISYHFKGGIVS